MLFRAQGYSVFLVFIVFLVGGKVQFQNCEKAHGPLHLHTVVSVVLSLRDVVMKL